MGALIKQNKKLGTCAAFLAAAALAANPNVVLSSTSTSAEGVQLKFKMNQNGSYLKKFFNWFSCCNKANVETEPGLIIQSDNDDLNHDIHCPSDKDQLDQICKEQDILLSQEESDSINMEQIQIDKLSKVSLPQEQDIFSQEDNLEQIESDKLSKDKFIKEEDLEKFGLQLKADLAKYQRVIAQPSPRAPLSWRAGQGYVYVEDKGAKQKLPDNFEDDIKDINDSDRQTYFQPAKEKDLQLLATGTLKDVPQKISKDDFTKKIKTTLIKWLEEAEPGEEDERIEYLKGISTKPKVTFYEHFLGDNYVKEGGGGPLAPWRRLFWVLNHLEANAEPTERQEFAVWFTNLAEGVDPPYGNGYSLMCGTEANVQAEQAISAYMRSVAEKAESLDAWLAISLLDIVNGYGLWVHVSTYDDKYNDDPYDDDEAEASINTVREQIFDLTWDSKDSPALKWVQEFDFLNVVVPQMESRVRESLQTAPSEAVFQERLAMFAPLKEMLGSDGDPDDVVAGLINDNGGFHNKKRRYEVFRDNASLVNMLRDKKFCRNCNCEHNDIDVNVNGNKLKQLEKENFKPRVDFQGVIDALSQLIDVYFTDDWFGSASDVAWPMIVQALLTKNVVDPEKVLTPAVQKSLKRIKNLDDDSVVLPGDDGKDKRTSVHFKDLKNGKPLALGNKDKKTYRTNLANELKFQLKL